VSAGAELGRAILSRESPRASARRALSGLPSPVGIRTSSRSVLSIKTLAGGRGALVQVGGSGRLDSSIKTLVVGGAVEPTAHAGARRCSRPVPTAAAGPAAALQRPRPGVGPAAAAPTRIGPLAPRPRSAGGRRTPSSAPALHGSSDTGGDRASRPPAACSDRRASRRSGRSATTRPGWPGRPGPEASTGGGRRPSPRPPTTPVPHSSIKTLAHGPAGGAGALLSGGGHRHSRDEDCSVDEAAGCCRSCGVLHGDPCPGCGGSGYHREGCSDLEPAAAGAGNEEAR
jgi:hypothetical protein